MLNVTYMYIYHRRACIEFQYVIIDHYQLHLALIEFRELRDVALGALKSHWDNAGNMHLGSINLQ